MMSRQFMTLLLSGAIGISVTGCAATSPVMRAQSPPTQGPPVQQAPAMHQAGFQQAGFHQSHVANSFQHYQGGAACAHPGIDSNQLLNLPFHPVHRNSYTYNKPRGMMYPPSPSPAGMYQYPYYTFRGPTDFFMK